MTDEIRWFTDIMKDKLGQNKHKGGWRGERFDYLLSRLREETDELLYAHFKYRCDTTGEKKMTDEVIDKAIAECADVANFAMMIADNLKHEKEITK